MSSFEGDRCQSRDGGPTVNLVPGLIYRIARSAGIDVSDEKAKTEIRCPLPGHEDNRASAVLFRDSNVFFCFLCTSQKGIGAKEFAERLARPIHERTIARAGSRGCRWTSVVFDRTGLFEVESSAQRLASTRQSGVREGFGQGSASRGRVRQVVCGRRGRVSRLRRPQRARLFATLRPTRTSRAARSRSDARSTSLSLRP